MAATGTPTPNIGLRIPLGTDPASVDDINYNSNLIDTKLGAVGNDSVQDQLDDLNSKTTLDSNNVTRADGNAYIDSIYARNVYTLGAIKILNSSFDFKQVAAGGAYKKIFDFPNNATKPTVTVSNLFVSNKNKYIQIQLNTDGSIYFISSNAIEAGELIAFNFVYI